MTILKNWPGGKNPLGLYCWSCRDWSQQLHKCPDCETVWCDHCSGPANWIDISGALKTDGEYHLWNCNLDGPCVFERAKTTPDECSSCGHNMNLDNLKVDGKTEKRKFYFQCPECGIRPPGSSSFEEALDEWNNCV